MFKEVEGEERERERGIWQAEVEVGYHQEAA